MSNVQTAATIHAIAKAFKAEGAIIVKTAAAIQAAREATDKHIQFSADEMTIACATSGLTKAKYWGKPSGEVRKMVKALMSLGVSEGAYQEDMAETMVHCYGVAFIAGIPFTRDLKRTHKADGTPREAKREAADGAETTTGAVTTTTPEACEKTARKLITQLRMLQADTAAAAVVDAMLEFNPEFSETEKA